MNKANFKEIEEKNYDRIIKKALGKIKKGKKLGTKNKKIERDDDNLLNDSQQNPI